MKVHLIRDKSKVNKLTLRTLDALLQAHGHEDVAPQDADLFLVSLDDPDDLALLRSARKAAGSRPLVAGGFEGFGGEYVLAYADAVNVGEGYEFFRDLADAAQPEDMYARSYMLTTDKGQVTPSVLIDSRLCPLVRVTSKAWYYLAGRGCKGKCAFCETAFVYPNWHNSAANIKRAIAHVEAQKHRLTLVTNESVELDTETKTRNAQSVRVRDYLKEPERFKGASMLHFGIEGFTEEQRRYFGKPIAEDDVSALVRVLGEMNQPAEFFFVPGLPDTFEAMMAFAESVPNAISPYPKIFIKLTRLDPAPHTPLWTYDIRQIARLTKDQWRQFYAALKARNIRFKVFAQRGNTRQTWRSCLRRCSWGEVEQLGKEPETSEDDRPFMDLLDKRGLGHLLTYDGRPMPNSQIVTPWREARDKMAAQCGMAPVNYKSDLATD